MMEQKTEKNNSKDSASQSNTFKRFLPIVILAAIAGLIYWQGWYKYITIEQLALNREFLKDYIANNFLIALLAYMAIYTIVVALSFPGAAFLTLSGGLLFGVLVGGLATVTAATLGAVIIFLIAKSALGEQLASKAGPWVNNLQEGFKEDALSYMFFLRLVPLFPFWLVNIAPGILGVKLSTYFIGTFFGIMPGTFAYSYAGVGLDSVIDAQLKPYQECLASGKTDCTFAFSPSALVTKEIIIAFALLGLVALIPVILKRFRKTSSTA